MWVRTARAAAVLSALGTVTQVCMATTTTTTTASPAAGATVSGNPVAAVWRERHVDFVYLGRTARYSCDGLRDKVRALLIELGARRDLKILTTGCDDFGDDRVPRGTPSLNITFSSPALPDPAAKPPHEGDLAATDARFGPFVITSDAFRNMGVGDCELVEAFARQILPKLAALDLKRDISCVPYQSSGSRFLVQGRILKALARTEQSAVR